MVHKDKLARLLWQLDPVYGHAPWRASPTVAERVLHVHLSTPEEPQRSLCLALASLAIPGACRRVDWTTLASAPQRQRAVVEAAAEHRPTLVFMQLQSPGVLAAEAVAAMRRAATTPELVVVCWCGDVGGVNGPGPDAASRWAFAMAEQCDLMLYTSMSQVRAHRSHGMHNAAYLQIGFDEDRYHEGPDAGYGSRHDIVFLGNRYDPSGWGSLPGEEAGLRNTVVERMRALHKERFGLYGASWGAPVSPLAPALSGDAYRSSRLAMSVSVTSRLERYSSDRLFRALACGTPVLLKSFDDWPSFGLADKDNVLCWDTPDQAVDLAQRWLTAPNQAALRAIGRRGAQLAREHHGWGTRMQELFPLLMAARGQRAEVWRPW